MIGMRKRRRSRRPLPPGTKTTGAPSRRRLRAGLGATTTAPLTVTALAALPQTTAHAADTLGAAAAGQGRHFGAAVAANHLGESQYAATLDREFSSVTPENGMKQVGARTAA